MDASEAVAAAAATSINASSSSIPSSDQESGTRLVNLAALAGAVATKSDDNFLSSISLQIGHSVPNSAAQTILCMNDVAALSPIEETCLHQNMSSRVSEMTQSVFSHVGSVCVSSTAKTKGDYQKKYRATEKGRAAQRKAQEKYRRSDKGKLAQMRARRKWRENHPSARPIDSSISIVQRCSASNADESTVSARVRQMKVYRTCAMSTPHIVKYEQQLHQVHNIKS